MFEIYNFFGYLFITEVALQKKTLPEKENIYFFGW